MSSGTPDVTWFRLTVRGIGVFLVAWPIPDVIGYAAQTLWYIAGDQFNAPGMDWWYLSGAIGPLAQAAIGIYLIFGARPLIKYCTRGALGLCPACNYDVRDVPGAACPECGVPLPGRPTPPTPIAPTPTFPTPTPPTT